MHNWQVKTDHGWTMLWLDCVDRQTNTLTPAVLEELQELLQQWQQSPPDALVIASAKASGFIAGADIEAFTHVEDAQQAESWMLQAQAVFRQLEALPCRTLAWIDGFCLGGGLELALACDVRLATDDERTRLGFPEVKLGIHPGFGGSVRATQLIGGWRALPLMLTGRQLSARQAKQLGLVQEVVPARHRQRAIARWLQGKLPAPQHHWSNQHWLRPPVAALLRWQTRRKLNAAHYPAPFQLIDLWRQHGDQPQRMYGEEAASVARLITGDSARSLVRCFLLRQQLKRQGKQADIRHLQHVHVIGAGVMGGDIAAWCALKGLRVSLQDTTAERIAPAMARAKAMFRQHLHSATAMQAASDRLLPDARGDGLRTADVVIEAVFEDKDIKQAVLADAAQQTRDDALLLTNTSSIPLHQLAQALDAPQRLAGLHFFNPVAKMPLIEVVRGVQTDAQVLQQAQALTLKLGKLPLVVSSQPGFLVNRILMPYLMQAMTMAAEGVAIGRIDALACAWGMPVGPLRLADQVGLDVCLHVARTLLADDAEQIPALLIRHVEAGRLGKKSGQGFYRYPEPRWRWPAWHSRSAAGDQDIQDRLVFSMLNEAVACLHEQVVDSADACDAGMIFGAGFAPFRGGPMQVIASMGAETCRQRLETLEDRYGPMFRPHPGWQII